MVKVFIWLNIMVTTCQWCSYSLKIDFIGAVYSLYDGENINGNLGCPKGGQVASKLSLLE